MDELTEQVLELTRNYALWWYLMYKPNAERYAKVERNYPEFFRTIVDSLRQGICITTYRLFDKRQDVKSLTRLIEKLKASNPPLARELAQKVDGGAALIKKLSSLRHKVFGHRDQTQSPEDVFSALKLKPKEIEAVVRLAQDIISAISGAKSKRDLRTELRSCENAVRSDTHNLMQVLVKSSDL
jgi:hypothetical protein